MNMCVCKIENVCVEGDRGERVVYCQHGAVGVKVTDDLLVKRGLPFSDCARANHTITSGMPHWC